jgi:hypothetical protein
MQRALKQLAENVYDLLIIGDGIYGACVAWEATMLPLLSQRFASCVRFAKAVNLVTRELFPAYAVDLPRRSGYRDALPIRTADRPPPACQALAHS